MTSFRQIEANRRNARKSTGPITQEGKDRSRCNAVRHGLTAETVIGALEDAEDYKAFEAAIIADYDAQSAVERELVLRLASLLWRLRRATTMETGLFEIQAEHLSGFRQARQVHPAPQNLSTRCSGGLTWSVLTAIRRRSAPQTVRKPCPAPARNPSIPPPILPLISRVVFCVSPICPTMRSTASADTKQPFGAKPGRSCLLSMPWIAANHRTEGDVSVSAAGENCRTARSVDFRGTGRRNQHERRSAAYASLAHHRDDLIQRQIRVVGNQRQQKVGVRLQRREGYPPFGLGAMLPVSCHRCIHLIAELGAHVRNNSPASRRDETGTRPLPTRSA